MQSGDSFYDDIILFIQDEFKSIFQDKIIYEKKHVFTEHMGYFQIYYKFVPCEYNVVFENDRNKFTIDIYDIEQAKTTLYRIKKFENTLSKSNIKNAIFILENVLEQDNICFYIQRNKKLYKKLNGEYTRVMNIRELR